MSDKPTILVQLDTGPAAEPRSTASSRSMPAQHVFSYGGVTPQNVMPLVHGCIFTPRAERPEPHRDLRRRVGRRGRRSGTARSASTHPQYGLSVSLMLDSNGSNTTAAAAVRAAGRHLDLSSVKSLVLGATGPVGQRVVRLLARNGGHVRVGSRLKDKAEAICAVVRAHVPGAKLEAVGVSSSSDGPAALDGRDLVVAAGAAGTVLLPKKIRETCKTLKVAIDLNGVPPVGSRIEPNDKEPSTVASLLRAFGVGGVKMRSAKAAIAKLFRREQCHLDRRGI